MSNEFCFERSAWELLVDSLAPGSKLPVMRWLAALEQEEDTDEAFDALLEKGIGLDISALPEDFGSGQLEKQLRREARQVADGTILTDPEDENLAQYLQELGQIPAQGDVDILCEDYLAGNMAAARRLSDLHLGRAVRAAFRMTGRGLPLMDLIQEANLGLWQGIMCYGGGALLPHLDRYVEHSLARIVALQARESGVVRAMQTAMERFRAAEAELTHSLGRGPVLAELAQELGLTLEQAEAVEDVLRSARELDRVKAPAPEQPDEEEKAVEDTAYFRSRQRVQELLEALTPREAQLLAARFGLDGGAPLSPQAVAAKMGLTTQEVVDMEAAALQKLRKEGEIMAKTGTIAIDGPAGAGKSTIARRLAAELGYYYVDTGAIYRTVAYFLDLLGISPKDSDGVARYLDELTVNIEYDEEGRQHMLMNGLDVTDDIRTQEISQKASLVAANPLVREMLLDMQQDVAKKHNVIMDGRDIGTVVLPRATVKIFLTASAEIRAKRRVDELIAKGQKAELQKVLKEIEQRDYQDTHREIAPLKRAKDAVLLDTSELTVDAVIEAMKAIVRQKVSL